jgi:5-methylcytosine-specific restriction endonuclease McrA
MAVSCIDCNVKLSGCFGINDVDKDMTFPECVRCEKRIKDYQEYINSIEWKNKSFDLKLCNVCKSMVGIINLQTHHIKYPRKFREDNEDNWIAVCVPCHKKIHGLYGSVDL